MNKRISLLRKGVNNPSKVVRHIFYIFLLIKNKAKIALSTKARASGEGERLVIKNLQSARNSTNFDFNPHSKIRLGDSLCEKFAMFGCRMRFWIWNLLSG